MAEIGTEHSNVAVSNRRASTPPSVPLRRGKPAFKKLSSKTARTLAIAAHDLRNPISAIIASAEILREDADERLTSSDRQLISLVLSAGETALQLIEDFLELSAIEFNSLQLGSVDLLSVMNESISLNRRGLDLKRLNLRLHVESQPPSLRLDRSKILRVVNELLLNAIQYSDPGRAIDADLNLRAGFARIAVHDEGPGIAPEDLNELFSPFPGLICPGHEVGRRGSLGLAIAKAIVSAHRGRVQVTSGIGARTSFVVSLPIRLN